MVNFIAAFQCDFSQSLHLALYLRYAEPSARRQIKDAITTAILGVCNAQCRTVSYQSAHRLTPRGARERQSRKRAAVLRNRNTNFPQGRGPIQRGSKVSFDESTFNI